MLGIQPQHAASLMPKELASEQINLGRDPSIFRVEERTNRRRKAGIAETNVLVESREAHSVEFYGNCYAYMTEWAELPRLNDLLDLDTSNIKSIEHVRVTALTPGDFVLFRGSGDKEITRLIAEDILGIGEYERLRALAEQWKSSLSCLGNTVANIHQALSLKGLRRTSTTIRGWLENSDRIGPGDLNDVMLIAEATQDKKLLSNSEDVKHAISSIRSSHITAGRQLTSLILSELGRKLDELNEQPLLLDLEFGEAWVVCVQQIEPDCQGYPINKVNRLMWSEDAIF